MMQSFIDFKRVRRNFGKIKRAAPIPNLIQVQKNSYEDAFLQYNKKDGERGSSGLHSVLSSLFPIEDPSGRATIEYVDYSFDNPKYDVDECKPRGLSYAAPLKITFRLIVWDVDEETEAREIKGIKEQEVYIGDIPLMTDYGTFIINGTERVVVSQMHRSPGVFFDHDKGKTQSSGKFLYSARVIPYRGSWLDFEFDAKDILHFRIDRKRKLYVSTLLHALGLSSNEIIDYFYSKKSYKISGENFITEFDPSNVTAGRIEYDLINADTGEVVLKAGQKLTPRLAKKYARDGLKNIQLSPEEIIGSYYGADIIDEETGEVLVSNGQKVDPDNLDLVFKKVNELQLLDTNYYNIYLLETMLADKNQDRESSLLDIYKILRPGEPPTLEAAEELFNGLFFDAEKYDISKVGRIKLNSRVNSSVSEDTTYLTNEDILKVVASLFNLKEGRDGVDDIDHLGNRRVRSVGELVENQFRIGLVRMQRSMLEKMGSVDIDTVMPYDLVNSKSLISIVKEFLGGSQLSQFMDQTNPLSEVTHKRRLSALGPGGLTRERAGFEVRDVHPTHYGRICPIETPEGQNIGLINSLATHAKVNDLGFIESPYRKVENGRVTDKVVYLSAIDEGKYKIAQANSPLDDNGNLTEELLNCRKEGDFVMVPPTEVDLMDVSPMQVVSVAASLIPFLENNDANRALMGSNMQRQAVPLIKSEAPYVGTGIENIVAKDSGSSVLARHNGKVEQVDATRIVVKAEASNNSDSPGVDVYNLSKYQRSNHNTCINQKPLVAVGDYVKEGDVIADGPATDTGEIALGKNVLVGFLPWHGYNFEDAIVISERIAKEDTFTSIHIEEFEIVARDTRLGPEEITRDIPNIGDESLRHLDEVGIVHEGAHVKAGDILVGKVTPKSESPMTPEEKLLRAIFGEKASDVRDSSLRVPPSVEGTVVEVRLLSRRGVEKDERAIAIEKQQIEKLAKDRDDKLAVTSQFIFERLENILDGQKIVSGPKGVQEGQTIDSEVLSKYPRHQWWQFVVEDSSVMNELESLKQQYESRKEELNKIYNEKVTKIQSGDDLPQGSLKVAKVFLAVKSKLQPGDKMAGRHGNKGVISTILPEEDMPHLEDGTIVDVLLNPLGVPSRMNVGQILETHLGWAAANLGDKISSTLEQVKNQQTQVDELRQMLGNIFAGDENAPMFDKASDEELLKIADSMKKGVFFSTPVFDGAKPENIVDLLEQSGLNSSGQVNLIDGRTGEYFDKKVTVGYKYMLKLHHLVDDKIHARSIGPYSLVTQQPLGGKSHFGGQRFGEMECWALQAYGAAYTLQEMLTIKSDDVSGRIKIYESIIRGDNNFEYGIPESFNVMIKELRSLCLNVELEEKD
jgi:DNA-directed RNA polymerase subunit beta